MLHPLPKPRSVAIIPAVVQPTKKTETKDEGPSKKEFEELQAKVKDLERKLLELTAQFDQ